MTQPVPQSYLHCDSSSQFGYTTSYMDCFYYQLIKKQESFRKKSIYALLTMPKPLTMWITINWKIMKQMGIPDYLTCLLRNLYADQEATVRTGHGTTDWLQIGKGVCQGSYIVTLLI